jgi:hypothetical protein
MSPTNIGPGFIQVAKVVITSTSAYISSIFMGGSINSWMVSKGKSYEKMDDEQG